METWPSVLSPFLEVLQIVYGGQAHLQFNTTDIQILSIQGRVSEHIKLIKGPRANLAAFYIVIPA